MAYKDKLLDPKWQKKRLVILERDKWTCTSCGNTEETLHVHHIFYDAIYQNPWEYPDYCLITLCVSCHQDEHIAYKFALNSLQHQIAKIGIQTANEMSYLESIIRENFSNGIYQG